ncbi:MAG: hypothetical protein PWQ16_1576 [bacterium]|nr:MAG: hypothetical protein XD52_1398 [bacterium 42_11]MDK2872224.1 hypothetical protein [bacterium]
MGALIFNKGVVFRLLLAVSACLLGIPCRYDGRAKVNDEVLNLFLSGVEVLPFCPECWGGLGVPREPAEIVGGTGKEVWEGKAKVLTKSGKDLTSQFKLGAKRVLEVCEKLSVSLFVLKEKSPSCGISLIYDGSFTGRVKHGMGVLAYILKEKGYKLKNELEINNICFKKGDINGY